MNDTVPQAVMYLQNLCVFCYCHGSENRYQACALHFRASQNRIVWEKDQCSSLAMEIRLIYKHMYTYIQWIFCDGIENALKLYLLLMELINCCQRSSS